MPVVQFGNRIPVRQVEGFPYGCERSCDGALHVSPGTTKYVTVGELELLQSLNVPLRVIPEPIAPVEAPEAPKIEPLQDLPEEPQREAKEPSHIPERQEWWEESAFEEEAPEAPSRRRKGKK